MTARNTIEKILAAHVRKTEGCWEWIGYDGPNGYGRVKLVGRNILAHRAVYEALVGTIPEGAELDHLCRNRRCVNPAHLEPVTRRVNVLRGVAPAAVNAKKTHCIRGHEYTPENTRAGINRAGHPTRACRTCIRTVLNPRRGPLRRKKG